MRVFLDTNVLVAAFATRGLCADVLRTVLSEHDLVLGEVVMEELHRVLRRKLLLSDDVIGVGEAVLAGVEVVPRPNEVIGPAIRDRTDRWILANAVAGSAAVLVTGDEDLLSVADEAPLPILAPRAFWQLLRTGKSR